MRKVYINGNFYTFDSVKPHVQAVVIENGRFIDMGSTDDMLVQWGRADNKVISLEGKAVTPGLTDSHVHLAGVAGNFIDLDVTGITSKAEMLNKIKEKANSLEAGEWLIGRGWDENLFTDGGIPTIQELTAVAAHCPLFIARICSHAFLVNEKTLHICQITANSNVPSGGTIVLDKRTKKPTGLLLESAKELVMKHIPEKSYKELKDAMRKAINFAMEKGLTSVHTNDPVFLGGLDQTYSIYDELLNEENLGLRCNLLIDYLYLADLKKSGMYTGYGNENLQIGAVKIFADGALGRRTALLSEPYADMPHEYGEAMFSQEELYKIVKEARELSMPVAIHTIGDQALENALDILDQFKAVSYRDRFVHVQVIRKELMKRLVMQSRIADIQPRFVAGDFPWVEERLGKERMNNAYAWKSLLCAGVRCAGGSDAPVEPIDPLLGIHAAVTRRIPGEGHDGFYPNEKLSMYEAFSLFTKMAAYATNEEDSKGTITRGKLADMTVYSKNPFELNNVDELLQTNIEKTIIGGEITYEK